MPDRKRLAILADHFRKVKAGETKVGVYMEKLLTGVASA